MAFARTDAVACLCLIGLVACGGSHPTNDEAYGATLASACDGSAITVAEAEALWQLAGALPPSCAAEARTCEAFAECMTPPPMPCAGPDACDGDTLVRCVAGVEVREGCGATCVEGGGGAACVDAEETCSATRCLDEQTLLVCVGGVGVRATDCGDRLGGGICAVQDGVAACTPTADECPDGRTECDGDNGRVCYRGAWVDFRCGDIEGYTCQVPEAGTLRCITR